MKRQQAAEDAIALGIRAMATGEHYNYLPPGPILGLPLAMQSQEHSNAERRIRGRIQNSFYICVQLGNHYFFNTFLEVEMYRQKKLSEDITSKDDHEKSSGDEGNVEKPPQIEAPTSTSPTSQLHKTESKVPSKSPDIVSSTLSSTKEPSSHLEKSMEMLKQIFPGKPQKILEAKLREARGDVVRALELCAKYFDQKEPSKTMQQFSPAPAAPPPSSAPPISRGAMLTPPPQENNNNPFLLNFSHVNGGANETSGRFPPPFSTAAMAAMLANSQHKSAFIPTSAAAVASAASGTHNFYRNFEQHHPAAAANFFNKDLFPFPPPPIFPPSFFVGFGGGNHLLSQNLPTNLSLNDPSLHRPCVDPLCGQCAPKADSTEDTHCKDRADNAKVEEMKQD